MAIINRHFTVIHKFPIPEHLWRDPDSWRPKNEWEQPFRQWCRDNLQPGFEVVQLFGDRWVVNVTDEVDYDLLVLTWGK